MKINRIFIAVSISVILSGCIRDDLSKCPEAERYVCFESVMSKYDFRDIVDHTTLYIYDAGNMLVFSNTYTVEELINNEYRAYIPIQENGDYTLLASVNSGSDYLKKAPSGLLGFETSLIASQGDIVNRQQRDIYHGFRTITFEEKHKDEIMYDVVRLYKNTNHINITLKYDGYDLPEDHAFSIIINADNGAYDYQNKNIRNNDRNYMPHGHRSALEVEYYDFTVMHVRNGNKIKLELDVLSEDGKIYSSLQKDLMAEIMKLYPTDKELDQEDIFDIEIVLGESMCIVELKINGWHTIRDGVDV